MRLDTICYPHEWVEGDYCTQCNTQKATEPDDGYDSDNDLWNGDE